MQKWTAEPLVREKTSLGEGALWYEKLSVLLWVDINGKKLFVYNPEDGSNKTYDLPQMVGTVVPRSRGGVVVALEDNVSALDLDTGKLVKMVSVEKGVSESRFNDGKCDPAGRFWVGTMWLSKPRQFRTLYMIDAQMNVVPKLDGVSTSNGIVWSSDSKTMYFVDSPLGRIDAFDFDTIEGEISNRRVVVSVPSEVRTPDGMWIDDEDNLWTAHYGGGCVCRWNPTSGKMIGKVEVPGAKAVTSVAFGGANKDILYITTASQGMSKDALEKYPNSGYLFSAEVGIRGATAYEFAG